MLAPSGENATEFTNPEWPEKLRISSPVLAFQSRAVLSVEPVRTLAPSGENATYVTYPV
jgi:hypothetical protein